MKKINCIYVCSKGRPYSPTIQWFDAHGFTNFFVVISQDDDVKAYRKVLGARRVMVAPKAFNTLYKKKESVSLFGKVGEWAFIVEDNIINVTGVLKNTESPAKEDFKSLVSPQQMLEIVNKDIQLAEKSGALLIGYASNDNHFFRTNHYREVGFVWGKMCVHKNDPTLKWDHTQSEMLDYTHTAAVLKHCGRVLINNFFFAKSKRYEGTPGSPVYEARVPGKIKASKYLVENFNGLFAYNDRPNLAPKSEVKMRMHSTKQIDKWRMSFVKTGKGLYIKT
jgi:hypothetical protein